MIDATGDDAGAGPVAREVGPAPEVVVGGRRYLLVPVEAPRAAGAGGDRTVASPAERLTARELQIAALIAEGLVNKQIAGELRISEWTVATHIRRIFTKLQVDTRAAMVGRCAEVLARLARSR